MIQRIVLLVLISVIYKENFSQKKVAIIGGGMAGVAAAHYIHQFDSSAQVTIYEKEAVLGGNAQTIDVSNREQQQCLIDIGPQYFTPGPWNDYITFLDETIGYSSISTESMEGTLLIQRENETNPLIVTPLNGKFRGEKLGKLLQLKKFNEAAFSVYKSPEKWRNKNIREWVESLDFSIQYKTELLYPFLAASLGTSIDDIKKTSVVEIVNLFAFRKPKASNRFNIMQEGMGTLIQKVGQKLKQTGVNIKTHTPVQAITQTEKGYEITALQNGEIVTEKADFVVMAVHADVARKLLNTDNTFGGMCELLSQLPYFKAHIVLHKDNQYINSEKPAFLNIFTDKENNLTSSTMNLSMISKRLDGIYKSWMSEEAVQQVKAKGLFLHETTFYHPLITPEFVANLKKLHTVTASQPRFCIIGGWSDGLETQNSAVLSGKRALEIYKQATFAF